MDRFGMITMTSLDAPRTMIKVQKDRSGNEYIGITGSFILLCPVATAKYRTANESEYDPTPRTSSSAPTSRAEFSAPLSIPLPVRYAPGICSPIQTISDLRGAVPERTGNPTPKEVTHTNVDGVQWLIHLDYGVNVVDYALRVPQRRRLIATLRGLQIWPPISPGLRCSDYTNTTYAAIAVYARLPSWQHHLRLRW